MKRITMLVWMMVAMVIAFGSVSVQADGPTLTIRHFMNRGIINAGDGIPLFFNNGADQPIVEFRENGKNIMVDPSGTEQDNSTKVLPFLYYPVEIPDLYFPGLSLLVYESACSFRYFGSGYWDGLSYRTVRDMIVTLTYPRRYRNSSAYGLPAISVVLQIQADGIGKKNFPLSITNGIVEVKYRVVLHPNGNNSVTLISTR